MGSQRGQATVEWIGLVLLLALGLGTLARLAPWPDGRGLGTALLHSVTCAARGGCDAERDMPGSSGPPPARRGGADRLVTVPPLVPVTLGERPLTRPRSRPWQRLRAPRLTGRTLARARRRAGVLWRRAWVICLGYERIRYGLQNPEMRFPHQTIPAAEGLRIANDCLSPVDLMRDWDWIWGPR